MANLKDEADNHLIELAVAGNAQIPATHNVMPEFDAFTRFKAMAATGDAKEGLRLLEKLESLTNPINSQT